MLPRTAQSDSGDTLLEIIIAVAIMAIASVAILVGLQTAISTSVAHKKQASAGAILRDLGDYLASSKSTYVGTCVAAADKTAYNLQAQAWAGTQFPGYTVAVTDVAYWTGTGFGSCTTDPGFERIGVEVDSTDGAATESFSVGKRKTS